MVVFALIITTSVATAQVNDWPDTGKDQSHALPYISLEQLNAIPDILTVEGREYYLDVYLSRDFMPVSPPGGRPLYSTIYFKSKDARPIGSSLSAVAFWLVQGDFIWKDWIREDTYEAPKPGQIKLRHTEGPKLSPDTYVDVIVMVRDLSGKTFFLKAPKQFIRKTS